jgi:CDP-diacylglycerol--serine O-phosphatidyltransferase
VALLIAYPWVLLTAGTLAYLVSLPFGWLSYRGYEQRSRESKVEAATQAAAAPSTPAAPGIARSAENEERPSRLN